MAYGMKITGPDGFGTAFDSTSPGGVFVRYAVLSTTVPSSSFSYIDLGSTFVGNIITLFPLQSGDHLYELEPGSNAGSGQTAKIRYRSNSNASSNPSRRDTILMVFSR